MKTAIVGCGHIAAKHIKALQTIAEVNVVAVIDKNEELSAEFARKHSIGLSAGNLEEVLQTVAPDVVHILTPPHTHHTLAAAALKMGCHVLVEKPLTILPRHCREMADVEQACSGTISVCHNFLYVPAFQHALELVRSGAIGTVESAEAYWRVSAGGPDKRYQNIDWIAELPGGIYGEVGAHPLYLLRAILGEMEVTAAEIIDGTEREGPDMSQLRVLLRSTSSLGSITISTNAMPVEKYVRIAGSKMSLLVDLGTNVLIKRRALGFSIPGRAILNLDTALQYFAKTTKNIFLTSIGRMPRGHEIFLREYYARLAAGDAPQISLEDGTATVNLLNAIWALSSGSHQSASG